MSEQNNTPTPSAPLPQNGSSQRLAALDIFRALTIILMILVNNGAGHEIYSQLVHSKWNGLTACDLVFPFFLYIVGFTTYISMKKQNFAWSRPVFVKIVRRTLKLFVIGLLINWLDMACDGRPFDMAHLRVWGVLQRIAICYFAVAAFAVTFSHRRALPVAVVLLVGYHALLVFGNGFAYDADVNIISRVDTSLFGIDHLYHKSPVDPEGFVSTIGAIAHCLLAFGISWRVMNISQHSHKARFLLIVALLLMAVGYMMHFTSCPLNKRVWSPSYVLVTCGMASLVLSVMVYILDIRGWQGGSAIRVLKVMGFNPMFLYVLSEVVAIVIGAAGIKNAVFSAIHSVVYDGYLASLVYSLLFIAVMVASVLSVKVKVGSINYHRN